MRTPEELAREVREAVKGATSHPSAIDEDEVSSILAAVDRTMGITPTMIAGLRGNPDWNYADVADALEALLIARVEVVQ